MRGSATKGQTHFRPPAHLCAVTYITEILLTLIKAIHLMFSLLPWTHEHLTSSVKLLNFLCLLQLKAELKPQQPMSSSGIYPFILFHVRTETEKKSLLLFALWQQKLLSVNVRKLCHYETVPLVMPPEWNLGAYSFCPVCLWLCLFVTLSVTLRQKHFNLGHDVGVVRDTDFIFSMHTQLIKRF